ncbi:hypothetical protein [Kitasatospora sp. NPDC101183]|uniref:hypothetical protein n=1 Tax=Kitasatospora sp. NPDC101183 TaxID=3364100 RepID=UPI003804A5FF
MSDFERLVTELRRTSMQTPPMQTPPAAPSAGAETFGLVAGLFVFGLAFLPLRAWLVMVGVGALHGTVPAVPAPGFGTTLLVLLGWAMLRGVKVSAK